MGESPTEGMHSYGIVVDLTAKNIILSSPDSILGTERIRVAKHEIPLLNEAQWELVDLELQRRKAEYDQAERDGTTDAVPGYTGVTIDMESRI